MQEDEGFCPCPLNEAMVIPGSHWTLSIVVTIGNMGRLRFHELEERLRGISARSQAGSRESVSLSQAGQKPPGAPHIHPILVAEPFQQQCFLPLNPRGKQNAQRQQREADEPVRRQKEEGQEKAEVARVDRVSNPPIRARR